MTNSQLSDFYNNHRDLLSEELDTYNESSFWDCETEETATSDQDCAISPHQDDYNSFVGFGAGYDL